MYYYLDMFVVISWALRVRFFVSLFFIGLGLFLLIRRLPDLFRILATPVEKRGENALLFCLAGIVTGLLAFFIWGEKLLQLIVSTQP